MQDGDVIVITASGTARFDWWGATAGPAGNGVPAPPGSPLPGASSFCLLGMFGGGSPFVVGTAATITVNVDGGPYMLYLGPNDHVHNDNAGQFDCVVQLYR